MLVNIIFSGRIIEKDFPVETKIIDIKNWLLNRHCNDICKGTYIRLKHTITNPKKINDNDTIDSVYETNKVENNNKHPECLYLYLEICTKIPNKKCNIL